MYMGELYRKSWDGPLLTCVSIEDIPRVLAEIDEGWRIGFEEGKNDQQLKEYLNFVDELRDEALYKTLKYKELMARTYNRRVKNRQFCIGDLVLQLCSASQPKEQSKLSPKWEGPYRVKKVIRPSTYELEVLDGKVVPRTWHTSKLCRYYV
ncbi:hypothetical protein LIER_19456 [Lithospermum erythrorhizon]|uniref:Tf2-1-like SH3-like domain-containing protein n=1 Tax=Lithospermum erythrorhizon TaxID=34254 RepID=A0AAV3QHU7_LITER